MGTAGVPGHTELALGEDQSSTPVGPEPGLDPGADLFPGAFPEQLMPDAESNGDGESGDEAEAGSDEEDNLMHEAEASFELDVAGRLDQFLEQELELLQVKE